jgi:hypothetical protein
VADPQEALEWLLSEPYLRHLASSLPDEAELISEGAFPDDKLEGFFKAEVRAFISKDAAGTHFIGMFRFSPSEGIIKKQDIVTGYYVDVSELPTNLPTAVVPAVREQVVVKSTLPPPARPVATESPILEQPRPTPTPKPRVYTVVVSGAQLRCLDAENSSVQGSFSPIGRIVSGPVVNGDLCTVVIEGSSGHQAQTFRLPSFSQISSTSVQPPR